MNETSFTQPASLPLRWVVANMDPVQDQKDGYKAFPGSSAFSDFRLKRLEKAIGAQDLQAIWVHYVSSKQELLPDQVTVLDQLLDYGTYPEPTSELYGGFMTFAPEWLTGSPNLDTSNWMYL